MRTRQFVTKHGTVGQWKARKRREEEASEPPPQEDPPAEQEPTPQEEPALPAAHDPSPPIQRVSEFAAEDADFPAAREVAEVNLEEIVIHATEAAAAVLELGDRLASVRKDVYAPFLTTFRKLGVLHNRLFQKKATAAASVN